ncbi:MAG TPA: Uma2 family endonuclease [Polyangiaceae bacterium]|nr:Uma2 family endonuclease [Polyangiaceae bacterium]
MANAVYDAPPISWDEFLALEWPHEWVGGVAYAMGATTPRHAQICARLARQLPEHGRCSAYAAGLVVYVAEIDRGFLPDLVVICGTPVEAPGKPGAVTNPTIVFEVLSASTQTYDRTTKSEAYQRLPTLQAYVLLHQHEARAEVFRRIGSGFEVAEQLGGILQLPEGLRLDLDAL